MRNRLLLFSKCFVSISVFAFVLSFHSGTVLGKERTDPGAPKGKRAQVVKRLAKDRMRFRKAVALHKRYIGQLMDLSGVVGTGIGSSPEGEPVVRVFTSRTGVTGLPATIEGIPVEEKVSGRFYAQVDPTARFLRPVPIGISTGHPAITAGTIGARVVDKFDPNRIYALSNNHVYAAINSATIGDSVIQPGAFDGGALPDDFIGILADYNDISFCQWWWIWLICPEINTIDAAIVDVIDPGTGEVLVDIATPPDGYGKPSSTIHPAFGNPDIISVADDDLSLLVGQSVQKYGRTTGLTYGTIDTYGASVNVCYDEPCDLVAQFEDQIVITPGSFSGGGDSGSLIVTNDENKNPVGLLFAGSATDTIANRIDRVLAAFNVDIDGGLPVPVTDIAVNQISVQSSAVEGDTVNVGVTVENVGNQDVDTNITVTLRDNGVYYDSDMIMGGLTAGSSTTLTFTWLASAIGEHDLEATATHSDEDNVPGNDSASTTVTVESAVIDIAVTTVSAPGSVVEGDIAEVAVTLENVGNRDVGVFEVILTDLNEYLEIERKPVSGLVAGGPETTLTFDWDTAATGASPGDHILHATHSLVDDNAANDMAETTVTVAIFLEDVAIAMVSAPSSVEQGDTIDVNVRVDNVGNQDVGPFDVSLTDATDSLVIGIQTVTILPGGATTTLTYSWNTTDASLGNHSLQATHNFSDNVETNDTGTATVAVMEPTTSPGPYLRVGKVYVTSDTWTTVTLGRNYQEMVVVCTPNYDDDLLVGTTMPVVPLVRNALGSSFEVRLGQAVGGSIEISEAWVHYMVVEAGVYDLPGLKMEADTFVSTVTDYNRSWVGQSRSYSQTYTNPVVVGQVLTNSSDLWTVFWCRGSNKNNPPSAGSLWVGKHKGEDPRARLNERIGYIVIEAGAGTIDGIGYEAGLGPDTIQGVVNSPPYSYPLSGLSFIPSTGIVTQAAMDGGNGSWALLYGNDPQDALYPDRVYLAVDEDQAWDSERSHTHEQVGYILFE